MLRENPQSRPNIYQVIVEVCSMRHRPIPIKDVCLLPTFHYHLLTTSRYTPTVHNQKRGETSNYQIPKRALLRHP
jgi:hypothetical protein